ncbi:transposase IS66 family protein, partial [Trichonephila inaurata madagascariensis]
SPIYCFLNHSAERIPFLICPTCILTKI